jgi:carboxyl-terminal processing protease
MTRKSLLSLFLHLVVFCLAADVPSQLEAQVRIPARALRDASGDLQRLLDEGQRMEQQGRWAEALAHYEGALRDHPGDPKLRDRVTLARTHFDIARRYADASFQRALTTLTQAQAIEMFGEMLVKIQTHYVQTPDWASLVRRGTRTVDVAMTKPVFLQQHLAGVPVSRIDAFRRQLPRVVQESNGGTRQSTQTAVTTAAQMASQWLGVSPTAIILEYACGAVTGLDQYSAYLTESQLDEIYSQIEGNFVGLGIELKADNGSLLIVDVIEGGPAQRAGIRVGDRIVEVDGLPTHDISTDRAADMLKGDHGTSVDIKVLHASGLSQLLRIRRERVEVPSVEDVKIIDSRYGVGYVRLTSFQKTTSRDMDAALWKLHRLGMKRLIIDVRGNPGGLLTASVELADKFLEDGTIVSTRGRSAREDYDYSAHRVGTWRVPLIVLIDRETASASEIFAGAVRDHRRGAVVGETSYGKGSVQGIFPLGIGKAGLRLTTARFYSPSGHPISQGGVSPDVPVHEVAKPGAGRLAPPRGEDRVLDAAAQLARQQVAQR